MPNILNVVIKLIECFYESSQFQRIWYLYLNFRSKFFFPYHCNGYNG